MTDELQILICMDFMIHKDDTRGFHFVLIASILEHNTKRIYSYFHISHWPVKAILLYNVTSTIIHIEYLWNGSFVFIQWIWEKWNPRVYSLWYEESINMIICNSSNMVIPVDFPEVMAQKIAICTISKWISWR